MTIGHPWWKPFRFPTLSDTDMRQLALDYLAGQLVTSDMVPKRDVRVVFPVLAMFTMQGGPKVANWIAAGPALVIGNRRTDKHGLHYVNGWPMFWSCSVLHEADRRRLYATAERLKAALAEMPT